MEFKTEFLTRVAELFLEFGAKTLTMDEVAREFGISKKTLYQRYRNKEALLEDVLHLKLQEIIDKMQQLDLEIDNAIDRMLCRDEVIDKAVDSTNTVLIKQLLRYYPSIFSTHMQNFFEKFSDVLIHNIQRGRKQGFYRDDFDERIYSKFFFQLIMSYDSSTFVDVSEIERLEYQNGVMEFYLQAITTEKGKQYLKSII
ncbi:TetR/AcrR family transcriptional regulator [Planobacterium oryzisoli]|uniref:TetR/AcrR family transcriptional regulator n=1 Tax=Planobacterium oryzisoli TaxID=2771435 RepID=A0A930YUL1_9FLAO|nr:TetR/AcrR family transcriptional regulator [Planobacterium oryzisoli]MBF5026658.1 TetR/AcrR family transcriptional regulator [Planobacterium oryzisoli]